jgi:hypothetical protein
MRCPAWSTPHKEIEEKVETRLADANQGYLGETKSALNHLQLCWLYNTKHKKVVANPANLLMIV